MHAVQLPGAAGAPSERKGGGAHAERGQGRDWWIVLATSSHADLKMGSVS